MKNTLISFLFAFLAIFLLSGCKSTRNTTQSEHMQTNEKNLSIQKETILNKTDRSNQRADITDELKGSMEFTKIEFENGETIVDLSPYREAMLNLWRYQYPNERMEPPDLETANPGIKSVTTGKLDFNKSRKATAETQTQKDIKQESSVNTELDITSEMSDKEISIEREKHGFFYFFGIFSTCIIGGLLIYYIHKFLTWVMPKIAKEK